MKTTIYLLFILCAVRIVAQEKTLDHAYLKCTYRHDYIKDTLTGKTKNDLLILLIGPRVSKCFSHYSNQVDSLSALPNGDRILGKMIDNAMKNGDFLRGDNYPHKRMKTYVYKNYPEGKMTVTDGLSLQDYVYADSLGAQRWTMGDSTKQVLGYMCQQATCDFRGRHWTAWFAPDIPVSDGPWKLGGLPGLILEAYDRGHQYVFTAVGLERVADEPIVFTLPGGDGRYRTTDRRAFLRAEMFDLTHGGALGASSVASTDDKPVYRDLIERDYK